jgi:prepilin-type N-terminal cleavage/methylation domain-containing protein
MQYFKKGFTLIELLIVIAIIGVLAGAVLLALNPVARINAANDATLKSNVSAIQNAVMLFQSDNQKLPTTVAAITSPYTISGVTNPAALAAWPTSPNTTSYVLTLNGTTTNIGVYATMNAPMTAGDIWCWKSATNQSFETTAAGCTP